MKAIAAWSSLHPSWRIVIVSASIFFLFALAIFFLFALAIVHLFSPRSMCGSHGNYTAISPDGTHRAVLYEYDCGATSDFGTHLAVQSAKAKFDPFDADEDSLVFSADSNHQRASTDANGMLGVNVHWLDASHLVVYIPAGARVFTERTTSGPVSIQYETVNP